MSSTKWPLKRRVEVEWRDSHAMGGWHTPENYLKDRHIGPCRSIGYVLRADDRMVTLIQSQGKTSGAVADSITIPKENIIRMKRVSGGLDP